MVIAIDGPAGAGKSSVARAVAQALGFTYLDTGAMYRAVALGAQEAGLDPAAFAATAVIEVGERVLLDGRDVTEQIRTPRASELASRAAADPGVRAALVYAQSALVAFGDWVAEGRDIATVVAPGAEVKVFLTASEQERAERRVAQRGGDPEAVRAEQSARDARDTGHGRSTLEPVPGQTQLDTTGLTLAEVVARVVALARAAGAPA